MPHPSESDPLLPKLPKGDLSHEDSDSEDDGTSTSRPNSPKSYPALPNSPLHHVHDDPVSDSDSDSDFDSDSTPLSPPAFYELIGMNAPTHPHGPFPSHLALRHGFYAHICRQHHRASLQYALYDTLIMLFLVLQIILSAAFIIIGSLSLNAPVAIAALGAVGSVIAGVLALIRGQGLPNRLRMERDDLERVVWEARELYWDVAAGRQVRWGDVRRVREEYGRVWEDARRNHPDTWHSSAVAGAMRPVGGIALGKGGVGGGEEGRRVVGSV